MYVVLLLCLCFQLLSQNLSRQVRYINKYKYLAIEEMKKNKIPASIKLAQALLESSSGESELSMKSNNHFGIKCKSSWEGDRVYYNDDEPNECFRKYDNVEDSFRDHSKFLNSNIRYNFLFSLPIDNYKGWAYGLKKAGYATNKKYSSKLINLIETHKLYELDRNINQDYKNESESGLTNRTVFIHPNRIKFILAKNGDSLESISNDLDISIEDILNYNDISYESKIKKDDIIFIQSKRKIGNEEYYIAKRGDTMLSIAQKSGIRLNYLYKYNKDLNSKSNIRLGQKILLR